MRALVIYESMFGNTETIARAVADGLSRYLEVEAAEVAAAPEAVGADVDLLVVGGPTHAFGLSRPSTRRSAADQAAGALVSRGTGLREWLDQLRAPAAARLRAAAFDTRVAGARAGRARVPGSAARGAGRRLRRRGVALVCAPTSFFVSDTPGPLLTGESERARQWAERIASSLATVDGAMTG